MYCTDELMRWYKKVAPKLFKGKECDLVVGGNQWGILWIFFSRMPLLPESSSSSIMEGEQSTKCFLAKKRSRCIERYVKVSNSGKLFEPSFLLNTTCCCTLLYIHGSTFLQTDFANTGMSRNTDRPPSLLISAIFFQSRFSVINRTHVGHHQSFLTKEFCLLDGEQEIFVSWCFYLLCMSPHRFTSSAPPFLSILQPTSNQQSWYLNCLHVSSVRKSLD